MRLLLLLLLMGSFMPTSVNLRGHSAQFTIECPPQTPTLPPPPNTDSVPGTSKVERHEQQQQKKSKMGTGPETLEHVSAFHDVCLSAFLSVCPRCCCCCSPCCCCCCFICTYWARLYVSDIYHRYMFFQFSNVLSECSRARAPVRVGLKCLQCLPTGAWLTVVYRLSSNYIVYKSIYVCMYYWH